MTWTRLIPFAALAVLLLAGGATAQIGGSRILSSEAKFTPDKAPPGSTVTLTVKLEIEPGWHLYGSGDQNPARLVVNDAGGLTAVGAAQSPKGTPHESFGITNYWVESEITFTQQFQVPKERADGPIEPKGQIDYMACDENSCDMPTNEPFTAKLTVDAAAPMPAVGPVAGPTDGNATDAGKPAADRMSLWTLILLSIGGGLFALAMPCTYPMIPITFSFFTKQAERSQGSVMGLALAYGAGIVIMFIAIGLLVGPAIIAFAGHWFVNTLLGLAFVFFAAVLFGWITLQPPAFMNNLAGSAGSAGGVFGVFLMGLTLVISSFTCTAPIVGTLLASTAQSGELSQVAIGMGVFGLTMAAPFVALSLLPRKVKSLPRSGEWMQTLKVTLGFVELAAALKFLSNVDLALGWQAFPRELFLVLWAAIFLLTALYLFGLLRARNSPFDGVSLARLTSGTVSFMFAFYFLYGAMGYKLDFVMTSLVPPYSASTVVGKNARLAMHSLVKDDHVAAIARANTEGKLILVNFTGFN